MEQATNYNIRYPPLIFGFSGGAVKGTRFFFILCCMALAAAYLVGVPTRLPRTHRAEAYRILPLRFEANQGQTDAQVQFLSHGPGYTLFLTSTEAVLSLPGQQESG